MARTTPRVHQGRLNTQHGSQAIVVDSPAWFIWLAEHRVFRFISVAGHFTVRREQRAAGWYWYAYRRQRGLLRSAYLGKSEELTLLRLTEIAGRLSTAPSSPTIGMPEQRFLLTTKMTPPPLATSLVARPRLIASLRKHATCQLLLVTGPAGSGKTTLLSTWLRELSCPVAWLSLDEGDNDLARFWSYVLAALQKHTPGFAIHLQTLLPTLQAETWEPFLILLINALATLPGEVVLVLDDYHLLTGQLVQESISFLVEHAPDHFHLIVASRAIPPFPLPRLRARGLLAELSFADLRFTQQETKELLRRLMDIEPSPEELSRLLTSTEGWVTGLTLAALTSHAGKSGTDSAFDFQRGDRTTFEYLASEVLARQPEQVRDFLLASSMLERFNGALCDAVTLHHDSQHLLRQLEQENLFLSSLDEHHLWYRYHQLFAAFLRSHLDQRYPGRVEVLHRRAAAWYAHHDMPVEAIEYALRARDSALAAHLIEKHGREMLMRHEVLALRTWVHALPEDIVSARPRLCIYAAWALLHTTHTLPVENYLRIAEQGLAGEHTPEEQQRALCGEIAAIRARVAIYQDRTEQSVTLAHQALLLLSESDDAVRCEVALSLGTTYEVLGETHEAEKMYREAIKRSKSCSNLRTAMLATRSLALLYTGQGRLRPAQKLYQDGLEYVLQTQQEKLPPVGFMYVGLGELFYEWNDLDAAERHLREGIALGQRGGDVKIWLLGYIRLIYTTLARGDREQGWSLFAEAERLARRTNFQRGVAWLQSIRLRLCALQGNVTPLLDWMQECGLDPAEVPDTLHEDEYQQLAQALIVCNEPDLALRILLCLLERVEQTQRLGHTIPLLLDLARTYERQGASSQALETLAEALALAEPQGYIRTFLDEGTQIAVQLRKLHQSSRSGTQTGTACSPSYLKQLLAIFSHEQNSQNNRERTVSLPDQLSSRELEVLHLLAAGHSNAEIAGMLVIGLNTVKTHLRNVYGKLGVRNRTQATTYARTLHLL